LTAKNVELSFELQKFVSSKNNYAPQVVQKILENMARGVNYILKIPKIKI